MSEQQIQPKVEDEEDESSFATMTSEHRHAAATDVQNAGALAVGVATLGAIVALTVSTSAISPLVGAAVGGLIGGGVGNKINRVVRWWSRHPESENETAH